MGERTQYFLVALAVAVLWAPLARLGFLSDDFELRLRVLRAGPLGAWSEAGAPFFRPLASASLWADERIFGDRATGWHLENVAWHVLATVLVGVVAKRVGVPRPGGVALLFGVLGAHLEPVAWIAARGDLLCAVGALAALLGLLSPGPLPLLAGTVAFIAALAAKEAALTLPLVGLVLLRLVGRPAPARIALWVAVAVAWAGLRWQVIRTPLGGYGPALHLEHDPIDVFVVLVGQVWHALAPPVGWEPTGPIGWTVLLVVCAAAAYLRGHRHLMLAFGLALLPVWGLRVFPSTGEGGRLLYLPSAFAVLALGASLPEGRRGAMALGLACVAHVGSVWAGLGRWQGASELADRFATGLAGLPAGRKLVLAALPDSVEGAYVFRQGAEAAWRLAHPADEPPRVTVVGWYRTCREEAPPGIRQVRGWIEVNLDPACASFTGEVGRGDARSGLEVELVGPSRLRIRADEVWAWDGQRIAEVVGRRARGEE